MTTATVDLVLAGPAGYAERTDFTHRPAGACVVDDWILHPYGGDPVALVVTDTYVPKGVYAITVASDLHLRPGCAWTVHLRHPMVVDSRSRARTVARHVARQAVTGALPIRPDTAPMRLAWTTLITTLAKVVREPEPTGVTLL